MLPELLKYTRAVIRTCGCTSSWRREAGLYRRAAGEGGHDGANATSSYSRQSCSSESSTQSEVPSQCQSPGIHRPVPQRNCPDSHPMNNIEVLNILYLDSEEQLDLKKLLSTVRTIVKRGRDAFDWLSMLLTALTSLGDKRASHLPQQLHNLHCTHSEPVWCSHWVASVEIRYHHSTFPDILQERLIQAA